MSVIAGPCNALDMIRTRPVCLGAKASAPLERACCPKGASQKKEFGAT